MADEESTEEPAGCFGVSRTGCVQLLVLGTVLTLVWLAWMFGLIGFTYLFHQRLTVAVETPAGLSTGEAVVEITARPYGNLNTTGHRLHQRGEAVVVELPGNDKPEVLFALLKGEHKNQLAMGKDVFADALAKEWFAWLGGGWMGQMHDLVGLPTRPLPRLYYPLLVTFTDMDDPASVKQVDPDDLDAVFGLCADGTGLRDGDAPWRAEGKTWWQWQFDNEVERQVIERNGISVGDYRAFLDGNRQPELQETITSETATVAPNAINNVAIVNARTQVERQLRASPQFPRRDNAADCHRLTGITLEMTRDSVTTGRVEEVLDYFWWSKEKRRAYTCEVGACGRNPIVIQFSDGTSDALSKLDFSRE
ncbi:MAG: hypothetical protein ACR2O0_10555 [Rhizobiaceae bacterium]